MFYILCLLIESVLFALALILITIIIACTDTAVLRALTQVYAVYGCAVKEETTIEKVQRKHFWPCQL